MSNMLSGQKLFSVAKKEQIKIMRGMNIRRPEVLIK